MGLWLGSGLCRFQAPAGRHGSGQHGSPAGTRPPHRPGLSWEALPHLHLSAEAT